MRKSSAFFFCGLISSVCFLFPVNYKETYAEQNKLCLGGMPAGFQLNTKGVQVVGFNEIIGANGIVCPAKECGLEIGDVICKCNDICIFSISDLNEILSKNKEKELKLTIFRDNIELKKTILPVKDNLNGKYKLGVLIRDGISGIGTITFIDKNTKKFGALGHSVSDEERHSINILDGIVYDCSIVGVSKGLRGKAGELKGLFLNNDIGKVEKIDSCGIFGTISNYFNLTNNEEVEVSNIDNVQIGSACVYSTIDGITPTKYDIEIVKIDKNNKDNKNFVIKVSDKNLIEQTGGIVQGMSGSPILQNNKIVGAITHVFLNDPTRGFGIDINTMLNVIK